MEALFSLIASMGTVGYVAFTLVVVFILWKMMYYTAKKVIIHLVTGYATYWVLANVFHTHVELSLIMWGLMALFGPIPVVLAALWQWM